MTENFAIAWAAVVGAIYAALFAYDMTFGPIILRWIPHPGYAFLVGLVCAAILLGPMLWVATRIRT